ncbi:glycosyltransferase [Pararhizobium sp. YC-54]|uniref:glycosyltransferase n=1 Tax=Pararhizobium sp. YC-54 TaxID=2986920 RepID=UPI0021F6EE60|nr:glycosyltransferase [Pararhizobium sp. YC-54]MCV9999559.1 glycosyltransferase [Pararhizobium sp. YC-54]
MKTIFYVITALNRGGAEIGLKKLIESGFYDGCILSVISLVAGSGELLEELDRLNVRTIVLVSRKRPSMYSMAAASIRLLRLVRLKAPDVLILSLPQANIIGRIVGSLCGVSTIISFEHNTKLTKLAYKYLFLATSPLVDVAFFDCTETARSALTNYYLRRPLRHYVVPLISFNASPELEVIPDYSKLRIVMAGRFTDVKNHIVAIEAVSALKKREVYVELHICGEGHLKDALLKHCQNLGVADQVFFPGFVGDWYNQPRFNCFLLTSKHEGLCFVALEALWKGIPAILAPVGGVPGYANCNNAIVLTETTPSSVAQAIVELIHAGPDIIYARRKAGQVVVQQKFGASAVKLEHEKIRKEVLL